MSFLAPLFLAGVAAVGLPILFHLIRRTIREKQVFSSLMFLLPTPPRVTRQNRLENLLLLLLRCLVIGLLALAFARPFLSRDTAADNAAGARRQVAILLDASASLQREDLWSQALKLAESRIAQAGPEDLVAIYLFDRQLRPVVSLDQIKAVGPGERSARLRQALATLKPGWGPANLGRALVSAAEGFDRSEAAGGAGAIQRMVVISDFAEGSSLEGLQGCDWPKGLEMELLRVKAAKPTNAGLQLVPLRDEDEEGTTATLRYRVSNSGDANREQFRVLAAAEAAPQGATAVPVYVPPSQSRILTATNTGATPMVLSLEGDDAAFDNTLYWLQPSPEKVRILYLGLDAASDPNQSAYYVERAFQSNRRRTFEIMVRRPADLATLRDLEGVTLILCAGELSPAEAEAVRARLAEGRTLLWALPSASAAPGLASLLNIGSLPLEEAPRRNFHLLGKVDLQHPLLSAFADARFGDFTRIHFWTYRKLGVDQLPTNAVTVASFDDGAPALVEVPVGKGAALILASGWRPADSQLALSTKFVPLLYSALERSGAGLAASQWHRVGEPVSLGDLGTNQTLTVRRPDGTEVKAERMQPFTEASIPGFYTVVESGRRFAVNLSPDESRTTPIAPEHLESIGLPLAKPAVAADPAAVEAKKRQLAAGELENRQKLWRWIIVAGIAFLMMETWLAGRLSRPRPPVPA